MKRDVAFRGGGRGLHEGSFPSVVGWHNSAVLEEKRRCKGVLLANKGLACLLYPVPVGFSTRLQEA